MHYKMYDETAEAVGKTITCSTTGQRSDAPAA